MFNLPLVAPPLSRGVKEEEAYDMPYIARCLARVMDEVSLMRARAVAQVYVKLSMNRAICLLKGVRQSVRTPGGTARPCPVILIPKRYAPTLRSVSVDCRDTYSALASSVHCDTRSFCWFCSSVMILIGAAMDKCRCNILLVYLRSR